MFPGGNGDVMRLCFYFSFRSLSEKLKQHEQHFDCLLVCFGAIAA